MSHNFFCGVWRDIFRKYISLFLRNFCYFRERKQAQKGKCFGLWRALLRLSPACARRAHLVSIIAFYLFYKYISLFLCNICYFRERKQAQKGKCFGLWRALLRLSPPAPEGRILLICLFL
jgi:hypothetical protein